MATHFDLSPKGPRGSAAIYGNRSYTVATFADESLSKKLDSAPLLKSPRRMDRALEHAARLLLPSNRNGRKIVVLLTGGRETTGAKRLDQATETLRRIGAHIFVVAIGRNSDQRELTAAVDKPQDIFKLSSSDQLFGQSRTIAKEIQQKKIGKGFGHYYSVVLPCSNSNVLKFKYFFSRPSINVKKSNEMLLSCCLVVVPVTYFKKPFEISGRYTVENTNQN